MNLKINFLAIAIVLFVSCKNDKTFLPEEVNIIPKPNSLKLNEGSFAISAKTTFKITNNQSNKASIYLNKMLKKAAGFELKADENATSNYIEFLKDSTLMPEAYSLLIDNEYITIKASNEAGWFYGVQTIRQLLPDAIESNNVNKIKWIVPCLQIKDKPRFAWRGMHMDFSRHFFSIDEVKTFLDYMALYKLNTYHMHLTDDQGWRIEIKKYPLLTEKGAWRVESDHDVICKKNALNDKTFEIDPKHYHDKDGKKMYGGFFTQEQIKEIIDYADQRCITVIPEIDVPGHFKAAIDNYPFLACKGKAGWGATFSIPACLGKETSYEFINNVLSEVADLFPAEYIHIGGDEVNDHEWKRCKKCQAFIKEHKLKNEHELQSFFNRRIEEFLKTKGKKLMGWDEIVQGGLTKDASMMWWRNWAPKMRNIAADNGNKMVISPDFEYYFDFKNDLTPVEKVYEYEPIPEEFTPEQAKCVMGIQANLWSEWIPNFKRLQIQAFPRIMALAERAWSQKSDKDYYDFHERMNTFYSRLDTMDVRYYITGIKGLDKDFAFTDSAVINLRVDMVGADIHYTLDGTKPTVESPKYTSPIVVTESGLLKASAFRNGMSGEIYSAIIDKQTYREAVKVLSDRAGFRRIVEKGKFGSVESVKFTTKQIPTLVSKISMGEYEGSTDIAFKFTGYFKADKKGMYEFSTSSDDGSLLYIGSKLVVNNGGNHGLRKRAGMIALMPGYHPITIVFHQAGGAASVAATVKVPGGEEQELNKEFVSID